MDSGASFGKMAKPVLVTQDMAAKKRRRQIGGAVRQKKGQHAKGRHQHHARKNHSRPLIEADVPDLGAAKESELQPNHRRNAK